MHGIRTKRDRGERGGRERERKREREGGREEGRERETEKSESGKALYVGESHVVWVRMGRVWKAKAPLRAYHTRLYHACRRAL